MSKKILGLDPGIASIGWAVVQQADSEEEKSAILDAGVVKVDFDNFAVQRPDGTVSDTGKMEEMFRRGFTVSPNLVRRQARQARRRLQHYKQRREELIRLLTANGFITNETALNETGIDTTHQTYVLRSKAVTEEVSLEDLARVLLMINKSRGYKSSRKGEGDDTDYLKALTERSQILVERDITVGQYLYEMLSQHPLKGIKNQTFYRKDYEDEFERIWSCQMRFHKELTKKLKRQIRDKVIFFQRPIESKKGEIAFCPFESHQVIVDGRFYTTGSKVCPISSPVFQEFRMWQRLNDLIVTDLVSGEKRSLTMKEKESLALELSIRKEMTKTAVVRHLYGKAIKTVELNFDTLIGNDTAARVYKACLEVIKLSGHKLDIKKMSSKEIVDAIGENFTMMGFKSEVLTDEVQFYRLWHLIYSFPGDSSRTGQETLVKSIRLFFNFDCDEQAEKVAGIRFADGYGGLSSKAIGKILPKMRDGLQYSNACLAAGYNHSVRSLSKEEMETKELAAAVQVIPHNSLRNPLVERILNKMACTINAVMAKHGQFDEIHIELPRELCASAEKRARETMAIDRNTKEKAKCEEELKVKLKEMGFPVTYVSRNDILKYRLYKELAANGYRTLYSNIPIDLKELILGKGFDQEHIIPKALRMENGYSNLTIEKTSVNLKKGKRTALDFVQEEYGDAAAELYKQRVNDLYVQKAISKGKRDNLFRTSADIPANPLDRLVDVLKDTVLGKYHAMGLTDTYQDKDGQKVERIREDVWSKRNDHRNHAMDAITVAFTSQTHIHYLNSLSSLGEGREQLLHMRQKYLHKDGQGNWVFNPPMPLDEMRLSAREIIESIYISHPLPKKDVATFTKYKQHGLVRYGLTPRGKLHDATIYGRKEFAVVSSCKVDKSFDKVKIETVTNPRYRTALMTRLQEYDGDAKTAFTGKNSLEANPIWLDKYHGSAVPMVVKCMTKKYIFTKRVPVKEDLNVEKVLDGKILAILKARLEEFDGDAKKAFGNIAENPIWLDQEKSICIKSVIVEADINDAVPIHQDENGRAIDFVKPNNNSHADIYVDAKGTLREKVVSFISAVKQKTKGVHDEVPEGWKHLFSIRRNEYFVLPDKDFNPLEINLEDPANRKLVARHLFIVTGISSNDYKLRLHCDASSGKVKELKGVTFERFKSLSKFLGCVKVEVDKSGNLKVLQKIVL